MSKGIVKLVAHFAVVFLLISCAHEPTINVTSRKDAAYNRQPNNIYIVSSMQNMLFIPGGLLKDDSDEEAKFGNETVGTLASCGIKSEFHKFDTLDINGEQNEQIKRYAPDAVLTISAVSATKYGQVVASMILRAELTDVQEKKLVWRAEINFPLVRNGKAGHVLSKVIINKMNLDGVIKCNPPQMGEP
jgi:hypothetical protein